SAKERFFHETRGRQIPIDIVAWIEAVRPQSVPTGGPFWCFYHVVLPHFSTGWLPERFQHYGWSPIILQMPVKCGDEVARVHKIGAGDYLQSSPYRDIIMSVR